MKPHEARNIGNLHNMQSKSMPLTFQDKVWQGRLLAKELPPESSLRENVKILLKGIQDKSKDSLSTVLSVVKYNDDNYEKFRTLVEKHEIENGIEKSIPQKLFRVLQGLNNQDDISKGLDLAMEISLEKASSMIKTEKTRRQLKEIFVSQTKSLSWNDAKCSYPEHAEMLEEYTGVQMKRGAVPNDVLSLCSDALNRKKHTPPKLIIKINVVDGGNGEQVNFIQAEQAKNILGKYKIKIRNELQKLDFESTSRLFEEDEEDITYVPETQIEL